jgi:predicted PurR-regulated permease PerM
MEIQTILMQIAVIIAAIAGGTAVVPVVNWLKEKLNLSGFSALALTAVVSLVIALAELIAAGELDIISLTPETIAPMFLMVLYASQKVYERINS